MADYNMVISGSVALTLFMRTPFKGANIDFYVGTDDAPGALEWFRRQFRWKGKTQRSSDTATAAALPGPSSSSHAMEVHPQPHYYDPSIETVTTWKYKKRRVQLIVCAYSYMDTIACFHSTVVMNIITAWFAYCLYPIPTLDKMTALINFRRTRAGVNGIEKYEKRGYRMIHMVPYSRDRHHPRALFNENRRFVGDKKTWKIPLTKDFDRLPVDCSVIHSWELWYNRDLDWRAETTYQIASSQFLSQSFIVADKAVLDCVLETIKSSNAYTNSLTDSDSEADSEYFPSSNTSSSTSTSDSSSNTNSSITLLTSGCASSNSSLISSTANTSAERTTAHVIEYIDHALVSAIKYAFADEFEDANLFEI
ncbi:hypothetical protein BJ165DRAFT_1530919 [Panaeolus papilionaceus]|nr:hypothetical protein BJ165DRAFT_1530919 [Panaeolus papilionaceus]